MDRFVHKKEFSGNRFAASRANEHHSNSSIHANSRQIENKKKVVADLMSLRRMKVMQQNRSRLPTMLNLEMPCKGDPKLVLPLDKKNVEPLLQGTTMKKELDTVFGEEALDKATEHFASLSSEKLRPNSRESVQVKRRQFLESLMEHDRSHLRENQKLRVARKEILVGKQVELKQQITALHGEGSASVSKSTSNENLDQLVDETGKKIKEWEQNIKYLKAKYRPQKLKHKIFSTSFGDFISSHREQVAVVMPILENILDDVHDKSSRNMSRDSNLFEILLKTDWEQWDSYQIETAKFMAAMDVMEEILYDVCVDALCNVCVECEYLAHMSHYYSEDVVFESVHATATGIKGKVKKAPEKTVVLAWCNVKGSHKHLQGDLWVHTQLSTKPGPPGVQPSVTSVVTLPSPVQSKTALDVISSEQAIPKLSSSLGQSAVLDDYVSRESEIWENITASSPEIAYCPRKAVAISATCLTYDHKLFAIGTIRGDILVYDMTWQPSRLIRAVAHKGKENDAILGICWSLDSTRLLSVTEQGCVVVWSASYAPFVSINDLSSLDAEENYTNAQQLTALCVMENAKLDFVFQEGPLTSALSEINKISHVLFDPALSFGGNQNFIVVALKSGDILRCNLSSLIQKRCYQVMLGSRENAQEMNLVTGLGAISNKSTSKIGQSVVAELFRYHRFELVEVCFVRNAGDMITLDASFNISQWARDNGYLSTFGWFIPQRKFKLSFLEEILIPKGEDVIRFEDEVIIKRNVKGRRLFKNKLLIERERQAAVRDIDVMGLKSRRPWYTDEFPDETENEEKSKKQSKLITRIYTPPEFQQSDVAAGGATFYVLTYKRSSDLLVKYAERVYETSSAKVSQVLMSCLSPSGNKLFFLLLYDDYPPNVRKHISIIDLDLTNFQLGNIGPIQINITSDVYEKCKVGAAATFFVSRVYSVCATEYIVVNVAGNLQVYSLLSGNKVVYSLASKDKISPKRGLMFPPKLSKIDEGNKVLFINPDGLSAYILVMPLPNKKMHVKSKLIHFEDNTAAAMREAVQSSHKAIVALKQNFERSGSSETFEVGWYAQEQAHVRDNHTCREMPTKLYVEMTLNTILDVVVARATGYRIPQNARKNVWKQDWQKMQTYFAEN